MNVKIEQLTSWEEAHIDALATVSKTSKGKNPSNEWKYSVLFPEHSPIRSCIYRIQFEGIPSWVATHLVRHNIGIQSFISTQRSDRTDAIIDRDKLPQGSLVNMHMVLNAQSWISISRRRLCSCASLETRKVWISALEELAKIDHELWSVCVKECLYRGFCPENSSCGYTNTAAYINLLLKYRYGGQHGRKKDAQSKKQLSQSTEGILQIDKQKSKKQGDKSKTPRTITRKSSSSKRKTTYSSNRSTRKNETKRFQANSEVRNTEHQTPSNDS